MPKKLRQSKTFWVNLLVIAAGAISGAVGTEALSPMVVGYLAAAMGVVNIVLRILTGKAVSGV